MAGFVRSDTDTTSLGIMMMAHSCQIGDDNDEDGESNSYQQNTAKIGRPLFCNPNKDDDKKLTCQTWWSPSRCRGRWTQSTSPYAPKSPKGRGDQKSENTVGNWCQAATLWICYAELNCKVLLNYSNNTNSFYVDIFIIQSHINLVYETVSDKARQWLDSGLIKKRK